VSAQSSQFIGSSTLKNNNNPSSPPPKKKTTSQDTLIFSFPKQLIQLQWFKFCTNVLINLGNLQMQQKNFTSYKPTDIKAKE